MNIKKLLIGLMFTLMIFPVVGMAENSAVTNSESNDEHIVWVKTPINFVVPTGKQRMLSFPERVQLDNTSSSLTTDKIGIYNNNGTLYITAHKAFKPILMQIKLLKSGDVVLVYLSSNADAQDNHPLDVVIPNVSPSAFNAGSAQEKPNMAINAVSLTRFAAQQFGYKRLAEQSDNITRTPMYTKQSIDIYYGDSVIAYPLISWRGGDLYVTAVQLKNTTHRTIKLDPREVRGNWQSASFFRFDKMRTMTTPDIAYNELTPQGRKRDYTVLFVVSDQPFNDALNNLNPFTRKGVNV